MALLEDVQQPLPLSASNADIQLQKQSAVKCKVRDKHWSAAGTC